MSARIGRSVLHRLHEATFGRIRDNIKWRKKRRALSRHDPFLYK